MQIQGHEEFTTVHEAQAEGVYSFAVSVAGPSDVAYFGVNTEDMGSNIALTQGRKGFAVFMAVGDQLKHKGAPVELRGFLGGSEF